MASPPLFINVDDEAVDVFRDAAPLLCLCIPRRLGVPVGMVSQRRPPFPSPPTLMSFSDETVAVDDEVCVR